MAMISDDARLTRRAKYARPILTFNGDKGGVGKSFLARIFAWLLLREGYEIVGIDGDARNGHLRRYYGQSFPVHRPLLRESAGWADVIDVAAETADDTIILLDLPAGAGDDLETQMRRLSRGLPEDRRVFHVWAACEEEDSVTLFERVKWLASPDRTLFVMNGRFGPPETFELWQHSAERAEHLRQGGLEAFLTPLPIGVRTRFARRRAPFHLVNELGLLRSQRTDFDLWAEDVDAAFGPFLALVGS